MKAALLIGFGGPRSLAEVRPFLANVLQGVPVPPERVEEVVSHYEAFGGVSPYNEITFRQKKALEAELAARGKMLPVFAGFRHSTPSFRDAWLEMKARGVEEVTGFILSSFRTYASFEKYKERFETAQKEAGCENISMRYTPAFHAHPLFIEAQADMVRKTIGKIPAAERERTYFIFSAHSVPVAMSDQSGYASQFMESSERVARSLGIGQAMCAYQSRSGNPRDPWLVPDVKDVIRAVDTDAFKNLVVVPIGFLCDNVEVLYDLDEEAKDAAFLKGLNYFRASTVTDHPKFIRLMADQILETAE